MSYNHQQPSCHSACMLVTGILCWCAIIATIVCAIYFKQLYWLGGSVFYIYGASQAFYFRKYKYLSIKDNHDTSLEIEWCGRSLNLSYSDIISVQKHTDPCGCHNSHKCCGVKAINANGWGPSCRCCCGKSCDNQHLVDIQLKEGFDCCGNQVKVVRVSTDDTDNLLLHLLEKQQDIQVLDWEGNVVSINGDSTILAVKGDQSL
eukprot:190321_1